MSDLIQLIEHRIALSDSIMAALEARKSNRLRNSSRSRKGAETRRASFREIDRFKGERR